MLEIPRYAKRSYKNKLYFYRYKYELTLEDKMTQDKSKQEDSMNPLDKNPCGICRANGLPICKGHGKSGGGSGDGTGASEEKMDSTDLSASSDKAIPKTVYSSLEDSELWLHTDDYIFEWDNPGSLIKINADLGKAIINISNNRDDLESHKQKQAQTQLLNAINEELTQFIKELELKGVIIEYTENKLKIQMPGLNYYDTFIQRLMDKNLLITLSVVELAEAPKKPMSLQELKKTTRIPAIATAIISDGTIKTQSVGVLNIDNSEKVTDSTVFEAASLSKPVFAYIVLKLAQDEKINFDLDTPLYKYSDFGPPEMRSDLHLMSSLPDDLSPFHGKYILLKVDNPRLIFIDQESKQVDVNINNFNGLTEELKQSNSLDDGTIIALNHEEFEKLITLNGGSTPASDNYRQLTARMILSHQAGLPNEFNPPKVPLNYVSPAGTKFDYSGEAYQFLSEVVQHITSKSLETLAQEEFTNIGMTNSSFMPPTGCSLIKLPDEAEPTPETIQEILKGTSDRHGQLSIIYHQNKLYVAERAEDGQIQMPEKDFSQVKESSLAAMKEHFAEIRNNPFWLSRPISVEARELPFVTDIVGHPPEHAATTIAMGHNQDNTVNLKQRFYTVHPAASLYTTAEDYAKFLGKCATDDFIRKNMFHPTVTSLVDKDTKAMDNKVPTEVLNQLAWGVGIGLQRNPDGSFIAFHWGDNKTGRNLAAINLKTNEAVVCLTNSANGPAAFLAIAEPVVGDLSVTSQWLSKREGLPMDMNVQTIQEKQDLQQEQKQTSTTETPALEEQQEDQQSSLGHDLF